MARTYRRRRRSRSSYPRTPMAKSQTGDVTASLSAGTQENWTLLFAPTNYDNRPAQLVVYRQQPVLARLVLRVMPILSNFIAEAVVRYWWGVRLVELEDDATLEAFDATTPGQNSLKMTDTNDQQERWLFRRSIAAQANATAANLSIIGNSSDTGSGGLFHNIPLGVRVPERFGVVFQHRWEVAGGGAPNGDLTAYLEADGWWRNVT